MLRFGRVKARVLALLDDVHTESAVAGNQKTSAALWSMSIKVVTGAGRGWLGIQSGGPPTRSHVDGQATSNHGTNRERRSHESPPRMHLNKTIAAEELSAFENGSRRVNLRPGAALTAGIPVRMLKGSSI